MRNERKIWLKNVIFWTETEVKKNIWTFWIEKKLNKLLKSFFFSKHLKRIATPISVKYQITMTVSRFFSYAIRNGSMTEDFNYQQAEVYESPAQPIKKYGFIFTEATQRNPQKKTEAAVYLSVERIRIAIYFRIRLLIWHKQTKTKWKTINKNGKVLPANFLLSIASPKKSTL